MAKQAKVGSGRDYQGTHPQLEFAVDDAQGNERIFKTSDAAATFAIAQSMARGGAPVNLDVLCWTREAAVYYGGEDAGASYDEDPEASVSVRIVVRAESIGRVA